jgi:integrase
MRELGLKDTAAEAIMRQLPKVTIPDVAKPYVRRADVLAHIEANTKPASVPPRRSTGGISLSATRITTRTTSKGEKRYLVYYRRGGRGFPEEYAGSFKAKRDAETRRGLVAGELAAARNPRDLLEALKTPPKPKPGLAHVWDTFIQSRIDVTEKARRQYRNSRDRWLPLLGADRDPATITADDVIDGVAELVAGDDSHAPLAASTIGQYASNLALVLEFAEVEPNPVHSRKVRLPRNDTAERAIPATVTWFAIRDNAKKRSRPALRLMEACALRVSEAAQLELGDIDFIEGQARIRREATKTAAGRRWVPVPPELLDEIRERIPPDDRSAHRLIYGASSNTVYADLRRACVDAGAPLYGTHALRHRRISMWLRHGIDPVTVARWAGHAKSSMSLDTYGHRVLDPREDEWGAFWLGIYDPGAADSTSDSAAPVRHRDAG